MNTLDKISCPFCDQGQIQKPIKTWVHVKIIEKHTSDGKISMGASVNYSRYSVRVENFSIPTKVPKKRWTIPKKK